MKTQITDAQFAEQIKYMSEEQKQIALNVREQIKGLAKSFEAEFKTAEEVDEAIKELKSKMPEVSKIEAIEEMVMQLATKVAQEKNRATIQQETLKSYVSRQIEENADAIKSTFKRNNFVEIEVDVNKAVGTITTGSVTTPTTAPAYTNANPENASIRTDLVEQLCTTLSTNQASFPYTEVEYKEGGPDFQTEGSPKSQMDFSIKVRYAEPKTLAVWEQLTEQSVEDVPYLQSVATDLLVKKHNLKKSKAILSDITTNIAVSFTAGSLAGTVTSPNIMDVINAGVTKIYTTATFTDEMPYMANIALVNPVDFYVQFVSAKDAQGHPLYPTASLFNQVTIGGITILPKLDIASGYILIGDMSKYNLTRWKPYTVKIGRINDDFIKNQFVILGESRYHAFVKNLDKKAFIYDTIANIKSAIEI